jgi:GNAT superfamily N-acetyltransferase
MVHGGDSHQKKSFIGAIISANAYSQAGCAVNAITAGAEGTMMADNHQVLRRVIEELPAGFEALRAEARAEGYLFVERLAADWVAGTMRFDRAGEALLAVSLNGVLAGVGGLTIEPVVPDALRMRRFYVRPAYRRRRIGHELAGALLERAGNFTTLVTVNAAPASTAFWESLGFVRDANDGHTHFRHLSASLRPK